MAVRPPDPESMGRIRHVVASAHKWGGDGKKPLFRKIRRVLLAKHPEVIAKAFGGNANVAAAWIKNNWFRMHGRNPPPTRGKALHAMKLDRYQEVPKEVFGENAAELFLDNDKPERDGDLVWITALRTGGWMVNPIPDKNEPLVIDRPFMEEVLLAWRENAWEFVTVPTYHTDNDPLANTGFVRELKIIPDRKRKGEHLLRAAVEFTEPEVAEKVARGTIAGVSVNVKFNVTHQETGKLYKKVLTHVALTNIPFINGLNAFEKRMAASAETAIAMGDELRKGATVSLPGVTGSYELVEEPNMEGFIEELMTLAKSAFDVERDYEYVRQQVIAQLSKGYYLDPEGDLVDPTGVDTRGEHEAARVLSPAYVYVKGMTDEQILVCAHSAEAEAAYDHVQDANGYLRGWVLGYEVTDEGEVVLDAIDEWQPVEKTWVALSQEFEMLETENLTATNSEGGDKMADVIEKPEAPEVVETPEEKEEVAFTREDVDRIAQERAQEVLEAYRTEQQEQEQAREAELSATRRQLHTMSVSDKVAKLNSAGHAPAIVKVAKEIMLADERGEAVLSLTRVDETGSKEVKLSATDIVEELLASFPATALTEAEVATPALSNQPEDAAARADALYEELYGDKPATTLSD